MSNPARQKGTAWETELLGILRPYFPRIERAPLKGVQDKGDFVNVPWLHEAKNTKKPMFLEWARKARSKAQDAWVILWKGDRRTGDGAPLVTMPLEHYLWLLAWVPEMIAHEQHFVFSEDGAGF